jgi:phosphatidylserine/phosphatidylglycerophosphate/cardiolipin synthase-like enzyme
MSEREWNPVTDDAAKRLLDEKALIIDRQATIMGSYNFSAGAARNSEDLNVVTSPEVAAAYARHWQARQAGAVRFADASEWCDR